MDYFTCRLSSQRDGLLNAFLLRFFVPGLCKTQRGGLLKFFTRGVGPVHLKCALTNIGARTYRSSAGGRIRSRVRSFGGTRAGLSLSSVSLLLRMVPLRSRARVQSSPRASCRLAAHSKLSSPSYFRNLWPTHSNCAPTIYTYIDQIR